MSFHRRLGFRVTKENDKGVEFVATLAQVGASRAIERLSTELALVVTAPNGD
ncbi:hypothetical protein BH11PSE8_BH11PSE8_11520 [soil metagenome]